MPYTSLPTLIDRFGERALVALTDRAEFATGTINTDTVDAAIATTDVLIDRYLAKRYALPLDVAQPILDDIAAAIVFWKLHTAQPDPKVKDDYQEALRQLQQIAGGTLALSAAGVEAAGTGGTGVKTTDRERPFTEANLKGWI